MFEGQSALEIEWDGEEECPPTVRSADSGVFERVSPAPKGQKKAESLARSVVRAAKKHSVRVA